MGFGPGGSEVIAQGETQGELSGRSSERRHPGHHQNQDNRGGREEIRRDINQPIARPQQHDVTAIAQGDLQARHAMPSQQGKNAVGYLVFKRTEPADGPAPDLPPPHQGISGRTREHQSQYHDIGRDLVAQRPHG